jgi:hypothetical protein
MVRCDDDDSSTRGKRRRHGSRELVRPAPRKRRHDRTRRSATGQGGQQLGSTGVAVESRHLRRRGCRSLDNIGDGCLGSCMSRRHRQPQHVRKRAGPPVGDGSSELGDLRRQDRFSGHDSIEECEPTLMLTGLYSLQQVAADQLPGEADPDPATHHRRRVLLAADLVVERPVEVLQRNINSNPGDTQLLRGNLGRRCPPFARRPSGRHASRSSSTRRQARLRSGGSRPQDETAALSASAREVDSHVKSISGRPKCPYAAVWL